MRGAWGGAERKRDSAGLEQDHRPCARHRRPAEHHFPSGGGLSIALGSRSPSGRSDSGPGCRDGRDPTAPGLRMMQKQRLRTSDAGADIDDLRPWFCIVAQAALS